jgi:amidohydrolase
MRLIRRAALVAAAMLGPVAAHAQGVADTRSEIKAAVERSWPNLQSLYRDLHRNPELAFEESRTASLLADRMRKLGFAVTEKVGKTGIVAVYRNGPGPVVLIRTDMDALPMEEKTGLPFASRVRRIVDGKDTAVAHSCGHDAHMAWWVGTAEALLAVKNRWSGTLLFIGQPAEEIVSGAKAMIDDGLLTRFPKPDYAFAAHTGGGMPLGTIFIKDGLALSAADAIDITFNGRGAHGSAPQAAIDPIMMGGQFITNVQTVISRRKDPAAFGVVTVGAFQAGTVGNIIPDKAELKLSLRSFTPEVRKQLADGVRETATAVAAMAGAPPPTIVHRHGTAATRNDSALVARIVPVLRQAAGPGLVVVPASEPGFSGSEDFAEFGAAGIPSVYLMIGATDQKTLADAKARKAAPPTNHSPDFAPAEAAIRSGAEVLALAVLAVAGRSF